MEISNQPGISLRAARERAGWSVTDVVHRTKFPRSIVEALEKDDYTVFSSPTYAKSYLSQYAEFLGVDPTPWLDFFEPASFTAPQDVLSMIESPVEQEAYHATSGTRTGGSSNMVPTMLLLLLTGGLIYGAVTGYAYMEKRLGESMANKQPTPPAAAVPDSGTGSPAAAAQPAPTLPAQARNEPPVANTTPTPSGSRPPTVVPPPAVAEEPTIAPRATIVVEE